MSGSAVEHSLCAFTCQHLTICQTGDKPNIINTSVRSVEGVRGWGVGGGQQSKLDSQTNNVWTQGGGVVRIQVKQHRNCSVHSDSAQVPAVQYCTRFTLLKKYTNHSVHRAEK